MREAKVGVVVAGCIKAHKPLCFSRFEDFNSLSLTFTGKIVKDILKRF